MMGRWVHALIIPCFHVGINIELGIQREVFILLVIVMVAFYVEQSWRAGKKMETLGNFVHHVRRVILGKGSAYGRLVSMRVNRPCLSLII
jgi:hypothetical protein